MSGPTSFTASSSSSRQPRSRFGRLIEGRDGRDFPYYNGDPVEVAAWKWWVIIAACAAGFAALTLIPAPDNVAGMIPRILFTGIPLTVFIALTGRYWTALFHRLSGRDVLDMVVFWVLNLAVSAVMGVIVLRIFGATANPAADGVLDAGAVDLVFFYLGTGIQLFGEELFTILPFLAVMYLLHAKAGVSRRVAVLLAWLITAVWFGAAHLPTYGWNFAQAFLIIGSARLVLTLAYIRTKNIMVSTGAHILNDWSSFTFTLAAAAAMNN
ncbi:CPBP family intramembrane metalloprotease [Arthrobacter sp. ATA002]|uniref:CPBP family intramembrane glutamic endopeptidase n=1 Tax=Arthrobacter sp. ATA002 TaxID=2991715 RepID=UPI0022A6CD28|nr:CPBP family intramembrane glutamic endopeptidase [Arthrobacter sp. ATA002]WAP50577.1 CPBP family intramembrane metalloprotease [Arthrobacter sp. ATA002]